jgi:hypothetical protein
MAWEPPVIAAVVGGAVLVLGAIGGGIVRLVQLGAEIRALALASSPTPPPAPPPRETHVPPAPAAPAHACAQEDRFEALIGRVGAVEQHLVRVDASIGAATTQLTRIETIQEERHRARQEARRGSRESA